MLRKRETATQKVISQVNRDEIVSSFDQRHIIQAKSKLSFLAGVNPQSTWNIDVDHITATVELDQLQVVEGPFVHLSSALTGKRKSIEPLERYILCLLENKYLKYQKVLFHLKKSNSNHFT